MMIYQLPSNKPINPQTIDLATRVMPEPTPVVTMFPNPSAFTPAYFSCFIQKAYGANIKTLKCIVSDGSNLIGYAWDDQGIERDWTDIQLESGMNKNAFYLIGSGRKEVVVMYLVLDNENFVIKIANQETLTNCQSPASMTSNLANIYIYCM